MESFLKLLNLLFYCGVVFCAHKQNDMECFWHLLLKRGNAKHFYWHLQYQIEGCCFAEVLTQSQNTIAVSARKCFREINNQWLPVIALPKKYNHDTFICTRGLFSVILISRNSVNSIQTGLSNPWSLKYILLEGDYYFMRHLLPVFSLRNRLLVLTVILAPGYHLATSDHIETF